MRGTVLMLGLLALGSPAFGISEKAIYSRCYSQLTGQAVPLTDSFYKEVAAGKMSAVDACKDLLHLADMNSAGTLKSTDVRGQSILNNFYQFHRTWFPTAKQDQIVGYRAEFESNTFKFVDMSEPSLYLTRNLFSGEAYKNVLSGTRGFEGKRVNDAASKMATITYLNADGSIVDPGVFSTFYLFANGKGPLKAINDFTGTFMLQNYSVPGVGRATSAAGMSAGIEPNLNFFANSGGGILGTRAFFLLNSGHPQGQVFDGALKVPRKWSKTAMESLMCLTLPALRETDVMQYLDEGSSTPFRRSSSCLRCHASMDQAAYTARNLAVGLTVDVIRNGSVNLNTKSIMVGKYKATESSVAGWPSEAVTGFSKQNPTGVLMFRSNSDGQLVKKSVSGIEGLGVAMSDTNDFYQCAAKRYFEYFTGISVSLYDRTDPANATLNKSLTTRDLEDRRFVEDLGKDLRTHQSLQKLIESILSSPYYRSANFSQSNN